MEYAYLSDDTIFHTCVSGQDSRDKWLHEKLEDTKGVIGIRISKNTQHNGQK